MSRWQDQWARMEQYLRSEAERAKAAALGWGQRDEEEHAWAVGYSEGLNHAVHVIEQFRDRLPATELEQLIDALGNEFTQDEQW